MRESQGLRGAPWRRLGGSGKQEVARGERVRGRHASVLLAREEDDRGEAAVGWAVLGRWWRQVSG